MSRECVTLMLAVLLASCGADEANPPDEDTLGELPAGEPAPVPQAAGEPTTAPLTVEDIDRWQRGMEAELRAVQEAGTKLRAAKTAEDTLNAMMAANDMQTLAAGSSAAGVSAERYQYIRTTLSTATGYLSPLEQEMDVSRMPAASVQELQRGREAGLAQMSNEIPSNVVDTLRPRAAALRQQDRNLTGERLKASGLAG
jgi:hypothetical protein